jgi:hypothetical protein
LEQRPNDYGGFSYLIKDPKELDQLSQRAAILLEPIQIDFLKNYHKNLESLVKQAAQLKSIPNLAKWLASLWYTRPTLEVHTTSELYNLDAVWLRFDIQKADPENDVPKWAPGINLLNFRNTRNIVVPELLNAVFRITGEINHNGYALAGRLHHPDPIEDEVAFYETFYNDKAFYRLPDLSIFWEFHGAYYESEEERRKFGLYLFDQGLSSFLNLYFGALVDKKELRINRDSGVVD